MSIAIDVGPGGVTKLWDNFAAPVATSASDAVFVPASTHGARQVHVRYFWETVPTVLSLAIQRSDDLITWTTLKTFTTLDEMNGVLLTTFGYIRGYFTTNTTGAGFTLEVTTDAAGKIRPNLSSTNDPDHVFAPFAFKSAAVGDGSVVGLGVDLECTGALHYYDTAIYAKMHCNVSAGNLRNPVALQGDLTFEDGCWVQGLGYGVGTYITFPNSTVTTGTFTGVAIEFNIPASWVGHLNNLTHSMLRFAISGAGIASFDTSGYLFELAGFAEGTGKLWSAGATQTITDCLRIKLPGGLIRYILLSTTQVA